MSEKQDFSEIGDKIRDALQDAAESGDFGQINDIVKDTVGSAMDEVRRQVNVAHDRISTKSVHYTRKTRYSSGKTVYSAGPSDSVTERAKDLPADGNAYRQSFPSRYFNKKGSVAGILYTVFGAIGAGFFGVVALGLLIVLIVEPNMTAALLTLLFGGLTAGCCTLLGKGCGIQGRLRRAERYMKLAREKMYLEIEELASRTGRSVRKVRRDVREMLEEGIFPEGHLDAEEKMLVLSDETWEQYQAAQKEWESKKQLEETQTAAEAETQKGDLTEEQQIEKDGRAYMDRLRQLNAEIPGEVISNKLYRLDYLLQRIFMVLKEHPEKCSQMRKFMDYYLPTTVKLVESYADFDKAGIQGENIGNAKAEIEKTMDTINQAFEKLLDDMYQSAAFEAAADAQVLKTVLAQDGYMKSEFGTKTQKEGEQ